MTTLAKETALITGANSGIGFEIVNQLLQRGNYHVYLAARSSQKGNAALQDLQSRNLPGSAEFLQLDVQSDEQIANVVSHIEKAHGKLDILVNNAGVALVSGATERERLRQSFDINATGPLVLTNALLPQLRKSPNPRVINVSSGAGSIGERLDPNAVGYNISGMAYRASKAALNMITACNHVEYGLCVEQDFGDKQSSAKTKEQKPIKAFIYCPGFTVSNLGEYNKAELGARSAADSVKGIIDIVDGKRDAEAGLNLHDSGVYAW